MPDDLPGTAGREHPGELPSEPDIDQGNTAELLFDRVCQSESETGEVVHSLFQDALSFLPDGAVLLLEGEMGAGKTTFCRALGKELGIIETVNSPTFNLLHQHRGQRGNLCHYDLFRLDPGALEELEFPDLWKESFEGRFTFHAIEWWQKARPVQSRLPVFRVLLEFDPEFTENRRRIRVWRLAE